MADYTEKIRNLLALAGSDNEHEARSALLMARKLMAKHKISEQDVGISDDRVIQQPTGIRYSARRDPWIYMLAGVIAEHHCCRNFQMREKNKQTAEIGFMGFEEDTLLCKEIFIYAVDCVRSQTKKLRKTRGVQMADSYGFGFAVGLKDAYMVQQKEENWALVLAVPETVNQAADKLIVRIFPKKMARPKVNGIMYAKGIGDGHRFQEQKRVNMKNN